MEGEELPARGGVWEAKVEVTQKRTVNFSGVLRQGNDVQVSQQGRGFYLLPPLKALGMQENRTGDIRFWRSLD